MGAFGSGPRHASGSFACVMPVQRFLPVLIDPRDQRHLARVVEVHVTVDIQDLAGDHCIACRHVAVPGVPRRHHVPVVPEVRAQRLHDPVRDSVHRADVGHLQAERIAGRADYLPVRTPVGEWTDDQPDGSRLRRARIDGGQRSSASWHGSIAVGRNVLAWSRIRRWTRFERRMSVAQAVPDLAARHCVAPRVGPLRACLPVSCWLSRDARRVRASQPIPRTGRRSGRCRCSTGARTFGAPTQTTRRPCCPRRSMSGRD